MSLRVIVSALAAAIFLCAALLSLLRLTTDAGGISDSRPFGYGVDEVRAYLAALSVDQTAFYTGDFQRLDTLLQAVLVATFLLWAWHLQRGLLLVVTVLTTGLYWVSDVLEGNLVRFLVKTPLEQLSPDVVAMASLATQSKWLFIVATAALLITAARGQRT